MAHLLMARYSTPASAQRHASMAIAFFIVSKPDQS
jgi:hypothetical protein